MATTIIFGGFLISLSLSSALADMSILEQQPLFSGLEETEIVSTIWNKADSFDGKLPLNNFTFYNMVVATGIQATGYKFIHSYSDVGELKVSGGPSANQEQCIRQLENLNARVKLLANQRGQRKDLNLELLLDTWGHRPNGMFLGNYFWTGTYSECKRRKIKTSVDGSNLLATRYCWALMKFRQWPQDQSLNFKVGVCLPEACDSIQYQNKYHLIENMLRFINKNLEETDITHLYCLPDEQSPMRMWWRSPKPLMFVSVLTIWLSLIAYSTWTGHSEALSLKNNFNSMFSMKREGSSEEKLIDLSVINGVKVMASCSFVVSHFMIYTNSNVNNTNEINQGRIEHIIYIWAAIIPIFAVDVIFTTTGILMAYTSFKSGTIPLMSRPNMWLKLVTVRYTKIMPYYLIMTAYTKYLSKYVGSGPFWDYGTDALSHRYKCEQESWLWTLFYGVIWKSPLDHCAPAAWSLANDFLFTLVTPIFFQLLYWRPKLGEGTLLAGILASCLAIGFKFFNMTQDMRPLANFSIYGINIYGRFMFDTYLEPQYRIAPYLFGLLIGYKLYSCERLALAKDKMKGKVNLSTLVMEYGGMTSFFCLIFMIIWPCLDHFIGVNRNRNMAHIFMYTVFPLGHLIGGAAAGLIVMVASTGHANMFVTRLLKASIWKPLSKIGLIFALINIEVIVSTDQIRSQQVFADNFNFFSACISLIIIVNVVAIILYLLIQAPLEALIRPKPSRGTANNNVQAVKQVD